MLANCPSVRPSVCPSVCLSVRPSGCHGPEPRQNYNSYSETKNILGKLDSSARRCPKLISVVRSLHPKIWGERHPPPRKTRFDEHIFDCSARTSEDNRKLKALLILKSITSFPTRPTSTFHRGSKVPKRTKQTPISAIFRYSPNSNGKSRL